MQTDKKTTRLLPVAMLALATVEFDYIFRPWGQLKREIEIRVDQHLGTVSFYDGLGLPIHLKDLSYQEIEHMLTVLSLNQQLNLHERLDNPPF